METLLVLAAGPLQVPAITTAKRLGLRVVAADGDTHAPGLVLADAPYVVDITDPQVCLDLARKERIDGVVHICSEVSMLGMGKINETLGLKGIDTATALRATNKELMRRAFEVGGAPSLRCVSVTSGDEALAAAKTIGRPLIVKPSRTSGKRGVTVLDNRTGPPEVLDAFQYALAASRDPSVVIEEFLDGPEFSVETLTWDGTTHVVAITDKRTTGPPHCVETGHSIPAVLSGDQWRQVEEAAVKAVTAVGIDWAPSHTELKLTVSGPVLMEIGARLGGGYITTELVPRATGIDIVEGAVNLALGRVPDLRPRSPARGAAVRFLWPRPGKVRAIEGLERARQMPGVVSVELALKPGDIVKEIVTGPHRVGQVIAEADTAAEAIARAEAARDAVRIITEES